MPWSIGASLETDPKAKRFRVPRRRERDGKGLRYQVQEKKVIFEALEESRSGLHVRVG